MDRLTRLTSYGYVFEGVYFPALDADMREDRILKRAAKALYEYEQTNITPVEISTIHAENKRLREINKALESDNYNANMNLEYMESEIAAYRQAEQDGTLVKCVDKRVYTEVGNNLWIIYDGEVLQVMHCGADVDADGKVYATLAADDKIFPYREPDAEYDTDPTDWCRNTIYLTPEDFKVMVYDTEESANVALDLLK